jgi:hypothetical protein
MNFRDELVNPYDPNSQDLQPETLTLDELIKQAIDAHLIKVRVMLPASITQVLGEQKVNVQPLLQERFMDNTVEDLPIIQNVMVSMPMGANYYIKLPIAVGDTGWLCFCDRSLDNWSTGNGASTDPQDSRTHDIGDPIFIPGLVPFANQSQDGTKDLVIKYGPGQFRMDGNGGFLVKNGSQELINNLINLVNTLSTASTVSGGPFIGSVVTALQQIAENLGTLLGGQ